MTNPDIPWSYSIIAGASAGVTELSLMYPLDVLKTRYQASDRGQSANIFANLHSALAKERFGIYRGILFPILAEAPKRAVKFTANGEFTKLVTTHTSLTGTLASVVSGFATGMTEGLVVVVPELIKIRLQLPENKGIYKSSTHAATQIAGTEGIRSLFKGTYATLLRNGTWNACYFRTIKTCRTLVPSPSGKGRKLLNDMISGTIAGTVGTIFNTPFDVIKTRIQKSKQSQRIIPLGISIIHSEGLHALWKGFVPKVVRLGPGGGIMLIVYEQVTTWLMVQ
jgi:solute carrier family 25 2-oxodicarboxylate transporter 21